MYRVREITYCKPGKVRPLVEKNIAMAKLMEENGMGKMQILTDFAAEQYWTVICEYDIEHLDKLMSMEGMSPEAMKKMEEIMSGYHEFVMHGRREIFRIEA